MTAETRGPLYTWVARHVHKSNESLEFRYQVLCRDGSGEFRRARRPE